MVRREIEHPWMMEVLVLDKKSIKPGSLVISIIEKYWFWRLRELTWKIRVPTPLLNCENFENMANRKCQIQVAILISIMLNFNWASIQKDMFIKLSCFQKITRGIMKVFMKRFCSYLPGVFIKKNFLSITKISWLRSFANSVILKKEVDATHGSLALKAYQQNLYLKYYY